MKRILICYFSGTGNTKKVLDKAKEAFENLGCEVCLYNIETNDFQYDLTQFDMLGISYPIHAFNSPSIVLDFCKMIKKSLKKVKKTEKKPLFIIKTSGEPLKINNISSLKIKSLLKKGYVLTNEYHYCMPYNIIFRHTDEMAFRMWDTAQKVIPIDCKEIVEGKISKLKHFPCGSFLAYIFRIEHWGGRFNGKKYSVNENCIKCGACARRCPTHNIKIEDGKFVFGKNCLMCMRCSFFCPTNAIKIGWFNKWKVNGPYNFLPPEKEQENKHKRYCKKSYIKYFNKMEEKIKKSA